LLFVSVVENGCAHFRQESPSQASEVEYAPMKWFETPSIVSYAAGVLCNNLFDKYLVWDISSKIKS